MSRTETVRKEREKPVLFNHKDECCGCSACQAVCPADAITMKRDSEGFLYPVINEELCVRCGKCTTVCPFSADSREKHSSCKADRFPEPATYAVWHRDLSVRMASRSGGIFTALSDAVLSEGGVIYGCVLTDRLEAVHIRAENAQDRDRMRGSKYIQSNMMRNFRAVKKDLEAGRKVLFSGTSCQIAGLRRFLHKEYDSLLCVDVVCHGVPSPLVWKKYLKWQENVNGAKTVSADFRNKKDFGWKDHVESLFLSDGRQVDSRVFTTMFYGHCILRPCCYKCPYKDVMHPGDITIADYWGIEKAAPSFFDNRGTSLVLVNTPKGEEVFQDVKSRLSFCETRIEDSMQPPLIEPFPEPEEREAFWQDFSAKPFRSLVRKYGTLPFKVRLKRRVRHIRRRLQIWKK